jgi:hypothetical protein
MIQGVFGLFVALFFFLQANPEFAGWWNSLWAPWFGA